MKATDFESECNSKIGGWLWDETFNEDYTHQVTLTVSEMRFIANALRERESIQTQQPRAFTESEADEA